MRSWSSVVLSFLATAACDRTPSPATSSTLVVPPLASSARAEAPTRNTYRYDLQLAVTGGGATTASSFSVSVSETSPGSVSFARNALGAGGARYDVGVSVKARLTMSGAEPRLAVEAVISSLDASGKPFRTTVEGAAATPIDKTSAIIDAMEGGRHVILSATPAAPIDLGPSTSTTTAGPTPTHALDVVLVEGPAAKPSKLTPLVLQLEGDAPAIAKKSESVPLTVSDGGVATPRQDTGVRVKTSARPRSAGLELDFDFEASVVEAPTSIRKMMLRGPFAVPFDKKTTLLVAEEDNHRYEVVVTAHRR